MAGQVNTWKYCADSVWLARWTPESTALTQSCWPGEHLKVLHWLSTAGQVNTWKYCTDSVLQGLQPGTKKHRERTYSKYYSMPKKNPNRTSQCQKLPSLLSDGIPAYARWPASLYTNFLIVVVWKIHLGISLFLTLWHCVCIINSRKYWRFPTRMVYLHYIYNAWDTPFWSGTLDM